MTAAGVPAGASASLCDTDGFDFSVSANMSAVCSGADERAGDDVIESHPQLIERLGFLSKREMPALVSGRLESSG